VRGAGGGDGGGVWRGIKKTSKEKDRKVVGWFSLKDITEFGPSIIIRVKMTRSRKKQTILLTKCIFLLINITLCDS
jgi:hypothetical protein